MLRCGYRFGSGGVDKEQNLRAKWLDLCPTCGPRRFVGFDLGNKRSFVAEKIRAWFQGRSI